MTKTKGSSTYSVKDTFLAPMHHVSLRKSLIWAISKHRFIFRYMSASKILNIS